MNVANIRVLLLEDSEEDASLAKSILSRSRRSAYLVDHTTTIEQALQWITLRPFDVCLVDMVLAGQQSGMDFVRAASAKGFEGPCIILTATEDPEIEKSAIHRGAAEYLIKSQLDPEVLDRVIRHAVQRQQDIAAIKQAEDNLLRARDELEDRVQQRTAELSKAVSALQAEITRRISTEKQLREAILELERINKAKSEFVANVSHELKTPITSILYGTRNLLKGIAGPLPEQAVRYLNMFNSECERLVNTINHILDLSRLDNHALAISPVTVLLSRLVHKSVEPLKLQADAAQVTVELDTPRDVDFVHCDPALIHRVLLNIVSNAIKFTPAKGRVTVRAAACPAGAGMAEITVTDNGIGIPANAIQRVTERYFRVGSHVSGTGLGLAISKEIVLLHGGRFDITSPPPSLPNGTRVTITLPVATPPLILVANTNLTLQALTQAQLTSMGYIVDTVTSGKEVLHRCRQAPPNLVLMDLILEDSNATEVILQLKEDPVTRLIPIVATIGAVLDETTADMLERFTVPTLRKPWQVDELSAAVDSSHIGTTFSHNRKEEPV